jgi:hypothetical protein
MELIKDDIDFNAYREEPETHKVRPASDFLQETIDSFYLPNDSISLPRPLWDKAKGKIEFRPGEVSLWAGINGHGKSMVISQVVLDLMVQDEKLLSMSFEMLPPVDLWKAMDIRPRRLNQMAKGDGGDALCPRQIRHDAVCGRFVDEVRQGRNRL